MPAIIALINPKSPTNVGAILRAAGCFKANKILFTGRRYALASRHHTDTQKAAETIPVVGIDNIQAAKTEGYKLVCVDLIEGATALPDFQHPENAIYVFGPEDGSISQDIIDAADDVVYVPTIGCLNLAATANIVLYDRHAKSPAFKGNDELIRSSRDCNNNTQKRS